MEVTPDCYGFHTMKRLMIPLVVTIAVLSGCTTVSHSDRFAIRDASASPDSESGYIYGVFALAPSAPRLVDRAVRFENETISEVYFIEFSEGSNPILVPVPPGTYTADFGIYSWDMFYWARTGQYRSVLGSTNDVSFQVEPGKIYYVGQFTTDLFRVEYEADAALLGSLYPSFEGIPVENVLDSD